MQKISAYNHAESDPYQLDILREGLTRFHRQLGSMTADQYPNKYHSLIQQQNQIGWDQLYRGRWSKEWPNLQTQYQRTRTTNNTTKWMIGLGRLLFYCWLELWKLRNEQRHSKDATAQHLQRAQILQSELRQLYEYKFKVCPTDAHLFHNTVEQHIADHPSLDTIETWILTNKAAIIASAEQATRMGITRNRLLDEYPAFNPVATVGD